MSTVADLMTTDVLTVAPEDTIGETAQKMVELGVSSAVVSDYGRMIGIVTERDLTRAVAGRVHTSEARVRQWMTEDPITAPADTDCEEAAQTMLEHGFRHLPVVDESGSVTGIVSLRRVVAATKTAPDPA